MFDGVPARLAVALAATQVVQMSNGDSCSRMRWVTGATQALVRFVYGGQQFDVGSRVALGEAAPKVDGLAGPARCIWSGRSMR